MKTEKDLKTVKDGKLSMDNVFILLWVVVLLAVLIVNLLGQFFSTVLLAVAIVAYVNKMSKSDKKA